MENDTGTQHIMYSTKSNRCRTSGSKKDDKDGHDYEFTADVLYGPTSVCGVVKHRSGWVEPIKGKRTSAIHYIITSNGPDW